jgi:hypothetical protein
MVASTTTHPPTFAFSGVCEGKDKRIPGTFLPVFGLMVNGKSELIQLESSFSIIRRMNENEVMEKWNLAPRHNRPRRRRDIKLLPMRDLLRRIFAGSSSTIIPKPQ